jgi:hypothetical protein
LYLHSVASWTTIGNQGTSGILAAAATWGIASFHNLFHKIRHPMGTTGKPEKLSYSFNN